MELQSAGVIRVSVIFRVRGGHPEQRPERKDERARAEF